MVSTHVGMVGSMLGEPRRQWPNLIPTVGQRPLGCWLALITQLGLRVIIMVIIYLESNITSIRD